MSTSPPSAKTFIRSGAFTGPRPGYAFKNGVKGMGYYKEEDQPAVAPSAPKTSPLDPPPASSGWSVSCVDGLLELTESEAAYLSTANLPTGMLPKATVRQVLEAAAKVIEEHALKEGQKDEGKVDADTSVTKQAKKAKKTKKTKKKKGPIGPVIFPEVDERVRDASGEFSGTARYIGTVHTSKNEHLNWVGVEWDDNTRGKHDGWLAGPGGGERYFKCEMGAGSFVRAHKLRLRKGFLETMKERYEHGGEEEAVINSVDTTRGKSKPIILIGMDKVANWHALGEIKKVSLEDTFAGKLDEVAVSKACSQIRELNLRNTMFGSWSEVAKLGRALPRLQSLRLDKNRFSPRLPYPLPKTHELRSALPKLSVLVLNNTALNFGQILALEAALPQLQELHLCQNGISTFDPPRTTYGAWAATTGDRRHDNRGRVGPPLVDCFKELRILNLSSNNLDDWRQVWRLAWLPKLEKLLLNENKISSIRHLGEWGDRADDSVKQSKIADYDVVYDAEVIKDAQDTPLNGTDAPGEYSTVDGTSTTKNQDMAKWARQTGIVQKAAALTLEEDSSGVSADSGASPAFNSLKSLSLVRNCISDWGSVDAVELFPCVEHLRLQHNPINKDSGMSSSMLRQTIIARIGSLKSLNGGEVRGTERADAEKLYIKRILMEQVKMKSGADSTTAITLSSCLDDISAAHPRAPVLLKQHGEPSVRQSSAKGECYMVSRSSFSSNYETISQILSTMKLYSISISHQQEEVLE